MSSPGAPVGVSGDLPAVILAAGKGTRMRTGEAKAAVSVNGRPMATRVIDAMRRAGASRIVVVVGHRADDVRGAIGSDVEYVVQEEQLGTGHAVGCAKPLLAAHPGPVLIAHADIPLLREADVRHLLERHLSTGAAATMLTAEFQAPGSLGRVMRGEDGRVVGIVEARDATPEQLEIREVNVAVYCFQGPLLFDALVEVNNSNAQGQYYLTDVIGILVSRGERVEAVTMEHSHGGLGVDTVEDLARARSISATHEHFS
jgi:bifunctional UDP-N-acetylglucosamine pyrophosphorylase/glucosamine-1-phosphate N-acetyltransferase